MDPLFSDVGTFNRHYNNTDNVLSIVRYNDSIFVSGGFSEKIKFYKHDTWQAYTLEEMSVVNYLFCPDESYLYITGKDLNGSNIVKKRKKFLRPQNIGGSLENVITGIINFDGELYLSDTRNFYHYRRMTRTWNKLEDDRVMSIKAMLLYRGNIILGGYAEEEYSESFLFEYNGNNFLIHPDKNIGDDVQSLSIDNNGKLYAISNEKIVRYDATRDDWEDVSNTRLPSGTNVEASVFYKNDLFIGVSIDPDDRPPNYSNYILVLNNATTLYSLDRVLYGDVYSMMVTAVIQ